MIGINDVWRHFDHPMMQVQVGLDEFQRIFGELIERTLPSLKGLVLLAPYFIEANREDPMRLMMDTYGKAAKELADEHGALFGDTQADFDTYLVHNPSQTLCGDRVHPNRKGHTIIAKTFLDAISSN